MKNLKIVFLLILFIFSCSESLIEEIIESYPNGRPKLVYFYKKSDGKKEILMNKYFYNNGQLFGTVYYIKGKKADFIQKNRNGLIEEQGIYKDGKKADWTLFEYNDHNDKISKVGFIVLRVFGDAYSLK